MSAISLNQLYDLIVKNNGVINCDNFVIGSNNKVLPINNTITEIEFKGTTEFSRRFKGGGKTPKFYILTNKSMNIIWK